MMTGPESILAIIDVQEKLLPVVRNPDSLLNSIRFLMDAAALLQVPVVLTEQYPRGLGHTVPELSQHDAIAARCEKLRFSAAGELLSCPLIATSGRTPAVVLAGIETHVCVQQTALELLDRGLRVYVLADACSSRDPLDHSIGMQRIASAGAVVTTAESLVFEWCETAGTDQFRALSRLVRERRRP